MQLERIPLDFCGRLSIETSPDDGNESDQSPEGNHKYSNAINQSLASEVWDDIISYGGSDAESSSDAFTPRSLEGCRSSGCILDRCRRHGRRLDDRGRRLTGWRRCGLHLDRCRYRCLHLTGCKRSCRRLDGPTTGVGAAAAASPAAATAAATPAAVWPGAGAKARGVAGATAATSTGAGLHHPQLDFSWTSGGLPSPPPTGVGQRRSALAVGRSCRFCCRFPAK